MNICLFSPVDDYDCMGIEYEQMNNEVATKLSL